MLCFVEVESLEGSRCVTRLEVSLPFNRHARGRGEQGSGVGERGLKASVCGFKVGRVVVEVVASVVFILCGQVSPGWAQVLRGILRSLMVVAGRHSSCVFL